jgi:hypothetical protein
MSEHSNIDLILEERARLVRQQNRERRVRQLLIALNPQDNDSPMDYAGVLRRLQSVLAQELTELEAAPEQPKGERS